MCPQTLHHLLAEAAKEGFTIVWLASLGLLALGLRTLLVVLAWNIGLSVGLQVTGWGHGRPQLWLLFSVGQDRSCRRAYAVRLRVCVATSRSRHRCHVRPYLMNIVLAPSAGIHDSLQAAVDVGCYAPEEGWLVSFWQPSHFEEFAQLIHGGHPIAKMRLVMRLRCIVGA